MYFLENGTTLEEIKERTEKASEGPWIRYGNRMTLGDYKFISIGTQKEPFIHVSCGHKDSKEDKFYSISFKDADFIAHARTDIPALVEEVEKLKIENENLRMLMRMTNDDTKTTIVTPRAKWACDGMLPYSGAAMFVEEKNT